MRACLARASEFHGLNSSSFFGDEGFARLFGRAVARARELGFSVEEIDFEPFLEAARLLYEGPWTVER